MCSLIYIPFPVFTFVFLGLIPTELEFKHFQLSFFFFFKTEFRSYCFLKELYCMYIHQTCVSMAISLQIALLPAGLGPHVPTKWRKKLGWTKWTSIILSAHMLWSLTVWGHILALWPRANDLTTLDFSFIPCEVGNKRKNNKWIDLGLDFCLAGSNEEEQKQ